MEVVAEKKMYMEMAEKKEMLRQRQPVSTESESSEGIYCTKNCYKLLATATCFRAHEKAHFRRVFPFCLISQYPPDRSFHIFRNLFNDDVPYNITEPISFLLSALSSSHLSHRRRRI